jgi:hypothetical protein
MTVDYADVSLLRPMVKNLINQMDFDALDYKLKKCKELFYLLESQDSAHEGGVVTANSLAIELHAGGLTKEHEVYVSNTSSTSSSWHRQRSVLPRLLNIWIGRRMV